MTGQYIFVVFCCGHPKLHIGSTIPVLLECTGPCQCNAPINCIPVPPPMVGNEGENFFVLLQNVALLVGSLPTPIFYKRSKMYGYLPHDV